MMDVEVRGDAVGEAHGVDRAVDGALGQPDGPWIHRSDLARQAHRALVQGVEGYDLVDHAAFACLFCRERRCGEEDLLGPTWAELPRMGEKLDPWHPHQSDGVGELGVFSSHYEVTRPAQHQTGSDALPLHGSDRGLNEVAPSL